MALGNLIAAENRLPFDRQIDQLFEDAWRQVIGGQTVWIPACSAYETEQGFSVEMGLPGFTPEDINLTVENGVLTVQGERKQPAGERRYYLREVGEGRFHRSFRLPSTVDAEQASASFKHGMLTIDFPMKEAAKPRRIQIEAK